jgi:NAD(P)-dependent dehydrogenase (short-subunit alcohol dehydrogenase family)
MASLFTLVTGSSSGIGRAVARRLGASRDVIVHGRDAARLAEAARDRAGRSLMWAQDLAEVDKVADGLAGLLKREDAVVDTLVHCAGMVALLPARDTEYRVARQVMDVNVLSVMEIVRVLLRKAVNQSALRNVVLVSALYSIRGAKGHSAYAASKGALDAWMQSLAAELAPVVRVNSVLPGAVETPMSRRAFADKAWLEKARAEYPLGLGQPDDVAGVVEFLVSDQARWITGQRVSVDGGRSAV